MKNFTKLFLALFFIANLQYNILSQTLVAGDIAFSGYIFSANAPTADQFSFVLLRDLIAGTTINFTDNGWTTGTGLRATETTATWTVPIGGLTAGKEIHINGTTATLAGGGSGGTISAAFTGLNGNNGDQILAYQNPATIIAAIHTNVYVAPGDPTTTNPTVWDGAGNITNSSSSALPTGLTTGTNAIWIGTQGVSGSEKSNAKFVAGPGVDISTVTSARAALNNAANWTVSDPQGQPPASFTLPTNENFLQAPLPVKLTTFTAKINTENQAQLNWKVAEQAGIQLYEIEKSLDAKNFAIIGKVNSVNVLSTEYQFFDNDINVGQSYYRLKIVEQNGGFNFSKIISLNFKPEIETKIYPNPSTDYLRLDQMSEFINQTAVIIDSRSKFIKTVKLKKEVNISINELAHGIYFLKLASGNSMRFIKN